MLSAPMTITAISNSALSTTDISTPSQSTTLKVQLLSPGAKAPTVAHPGEDLGYDVYACEDVAIAPRGNAIVATGIAIELICDSGRGMGALLRDKSSLAARRLTLTGGVIDAGYRGEVRVLIENLGDAPAQIRAGDKIANLIPYPVLTGSVEVAEELSGTRRKAGGFGSSGSR
ncbi:MAG TPA: dUTP diphosphatase [Terriglobales bacterium]|nr:dUTP diphosphatase [Terriglobales bacterium]